MIFFVLFSVASSKEFNELELLFRDILTTSIQSPTTYIPSPTTTIPPPTTTTRSVVPIISCLSSTSSSTNHHFTFSLPFLGGALVITVELALISILYKLKTKIARRWPNFFVNLINFLNKVKGK
jgi:hypothetical protein